MYLNPWPQALAQGWDRVILFIIYEWGREEDKSKLNRDVSDGYISWLVSRCFDLENNEMVDVFQITSVGYMCLYLHSVEYVGISNFKQFLPPYGHPTPVRSNCASLLDILISCFVPMKNRVQRQ